MVLGMREQGLPKSAEDSGFYHLLWEEWGTEGFPEETDRAGRAPLCKKEQKIHTQSSQALF